MAGGGWVARLIDVVHEPKKALDFDGPKLEYKGRNMLIVENLPDFCGPKSFQCLDTMVYVDQITEVKDFLKYKKLGIHALQINGDIDPDLRKDLERIVKPWMGKCPNYEGL